MTRRVAKKLYDMGRTDAETKRSLSAYAYSVFSLPPDEVLNEDDMKSLVYMLGYACAVSDMQVRWMKKVIQERTVAKARMN